MLNSWTGRWQESCHVSYTVHTYYTCEARSFCFQGVYAEENREFSSDNKQRPCGGYHLWLLTSKGFKGNKCMNLAIYIPGIFYVYIFQGKFLRIARFPWETNVSILSCVIHCSYIINTMYVFIVKLFIYHLLFCLE